MSVRRILLFLLALFLLAGLAGCEKYGKLLQGRVIDYDKAKRQVTLITAVAKDWDNPHYLTLPPVTMTLPTDPKLMGAEPVAGDRVELDMSGKKFVIYDRATKGFKDVPFTPLDVQKNVERKDPRLLDPATGQPRKLPLVDKENKTVTLYSIRQKVLATVQVADEYLSLPESAWEAGDEVRAYFVEEGKMHRLINISKGEDPNK